MAYRELAQIQQHQLEGSLGGQVVPETMTVIRQSPQFFWGPGTPSPNSDLKQGGGHLCRWPWPRSTSPEFHFHTGLLPPSEGKGTAKNTSQWRG